MVSHLLMNSASRTILRAVDKITLAYADRVVAVSENGHQLLLREGCPRDKLVAIPNGVDISRFHPRVNADPQLFAWRGDSFTVYYLGPVEARTDVIFDGQIALDGYTMSAWIKPNAMDAAYHSIITKGTMCCPEEYEHPK